MAEGMTPENSVGRHRIVAVLILIFGPVVAVLLWPYVAMIETARVEFYAIAAGGLILLFAVWAWKEYPPFPYYPAC